MVTALGPLCEQRCHSVQAIHSDPHYGWRAALTVMVQPSTHSYCYCADLVGMLAYVTAAVGAVYCNAPRWSSSIGQVVAWLYGVTPVKMPCRV